MTISVLLVDDHALIRQGLRRAFEGTSDLVVVDEAGSVSQALALAFGKAIPERQRELSAAGIATDGLRLTHMVLRDAGLSEATVQTVGTGSGERLRIKAEIVHGKLAVTVADSGLGFGKAATAGTGVGLANIRGNLISVIDLARYQLGSETAIASDSRIITFATGLGFNCGLLVSRVYGLRHAAGMEASGDRLRDAGELAARVAAHHVRDDHQHDRQPEPRRQRP